MQTSNPLQLIHPVSTLRGQSEQRLYYRFLRWDGRGPPADVVSAQGSGLQCRLPVCLQHEEGKQSHCYSYKTECYLKQAGVKTVISLISLQKTHAYHRLEDDVPAEVKQRRLEELISVFREGAARLNAALIGSMQLVLVEGVSTEVKWF